MPASPSGWPWIVERIGDYDRPLGLHNLLRETVRLGTSHQSLDERVDVVVGVADLTFKHSGRLILEVHTASRDARQRAAALRYEMQQRVKVALLAQPGCDLAERPHHLTIGVILGLRATGVVGRRDLSSIHPSLLPGVKHSLRGQTIASRLSNSTGLSLGTSQSLL